jgi:hypothetical protein
MRSLRLALALALAIVIGGAGEVRAQDTRLDSLRNIYAGAAESAAILAMERERIAEWADEQYGLIPEARSQGDDELRDVLRSAQIAADSLALLDLLFARAMIAAADARRALAAALEAELETVLTVAEYSRPETRTQLIAEARNLAVELEQMQQPLTLTVAEAPAIIVEPGDGPEEIALKADFLDDRASQLRRAADVVAGEMAQIQRRGELQAEVRRLVAEVRLFDAAGIPPSVLDREAARPVETDPTGDRLTEALGDPVPPPPPTGQPALDIPLVTADDEVAARGDPASASERLARLRLDLLRRAEALERQAEEVRRLLDERA